MLPPIDHFDLVVLRADVLEPGINHEHRGLWMGLGPVKDGGMLDGMKIYVNKIIGKQAGSNLLRLIRQGNRKGSKTILEAELFETLCPG